MFKVDYNNRGMHPLPTWENLVNFKIFAKGRAGTIFILRRGLICLLRRGVASTSFICFYFSSKTN